MKTYIKYIPHGIDSQTYRPIVEGDVDYADFVTFNRNFRKKHQVDFIVFWCNRNISRKRPSDVIMAFDHFANQLPKNKRSRVALVMHTDPVDPSGTDLPKVKADLAPNINLIFSNRKLDSRMMNFMHNMADVTINMASNEGFGLTTAESIMAGTPIVSNVTGGLQDQMRFTGRGGSLIKQTPKFPTNSVKSTTKCGSWVKPVFPSNRSLNGSPATPYIYDERCSVEDAGNALLAWYRLIPETRKGHGMRGREWFLTDESGMNSESLGKSFTGAMNRIFAEWTPKPRLTIEKIEI